ncbi:hypothetical protein [Paenisporosarcina sp. TG20]|nr:hypothetical protein [Paenisporosarcina sp. TG20]
MTKIKPKRLDNKPVNWEMSELSRIIVNHFADYSDRAEEIVGSL